MGSKASAEYYREYRRKKRLDPEYKEKVEPKKYEFDTWILSLPPINLYNVELVYLTFGYDQRWDIRKENLWEE